MPSIYTFIIRWSDVGIQRGYVSVCGRRGNYNNVYKKMVTNIWSTYTGSELLIQFVGSKNNRWWLCFICLFLETIYQIPNTFFLMSLSLNIWAEQEIVIHPNPWISGMVFSLYLVEEWSKCRFRMDWGHFLVQVGLAFFFGNFPHLW